MTVPCLHLGQANSPDLAFLSPKEVAAAVFLGSNLSLKFSSNRSKPSTVPESDLNPFKLTVYPF